MPHADSILHPIAVPLPAVELHKFDRFMKSSPWAAIGSIVYVAILLLAIRTTGFKIFYIMPFLLVGAFIMNAIADLKFPTKDEATIWFTTTAKIMEEHFDSLCDTTFPLRGVFFEDDDTVVVEIDMDDSLRRFTVEARQIQWVRSPSLGGSVQFFEASWTTNQNPVGEPELGYIHFGEQLRIVTADPLNPPVLIDNSSDRNDAVRFC